MKLLLKNLLFTIILITVTAGLVYWIEAEKEIEILCSMFNAGQPRAEVERTLNTANLLDIHSTRETIVATSPFNLHRLNCTISFSESDLVTGAEFVRLFDLTGTLTVAGLILSIGLLLFQILLALGFPLGRFAWGGTHVTLPRNLRIGSAISAIIFLVIAIILWQQTGGTSGIDMIYPVLGVLFLLSSYANFNSKSTPEKLTGTPAAILLFLCFLSLSIQ
jgi:hypothetical protein